MTYCYWGKWKTFAYKKQGMDFHSSNTVRWLCAWYKVSAYNYTSFGVAVQGNQDFLKFHHHHHVPALNLIGGPSSLNFDLKARKVLLLLKTCWGMKIVPDVHLFIRKRMKRLVRIPTHSFIPFNQSVFHRVRTPKSGTVLSKVLVMRKYSYLLDSSVYEVVLLEKQLDTQKRTGFVFFLWTRLQTHSRKIFLFEALFKTSFLLPCFKVISFAFGKNI